MKKTGRALICLVFLTFFSFTVLVLPASAGEGHRGHHRHHHGYRIAPYFIAPYVAPAPYFVAPYYVAPYYVAPPRPPIGAPPPPVIIQQYPSFPQEMPHSQTPQPMPPQIPVARVRVDIKELWEHRIVRHITGEPINPDDLPEDGAIMICNAESGPYRLSNGVDRYLHQQRCWVYEHPTGSDILRWEYRGKGR